MPTFASTKAPLVVALAMVLVHLAAGCWVPMETGRAMQDDLQALRGELQAARKGLEEQRAKLLEQVQASEAQIQEVSQALGDLNRAARTSDADFGVQMERLIREMQELRGATELIGYRLGKIEVHFEGESSLLKRLDELDGGMSAGGSSPGGSDKNTDTGQTKSKTAFTDAARSDADDPEPTTKEGWLKQAAKLQKEGNVLEARGVYRDILKRWPKTTGTADAAHFNLGEMYFAEKKYSAAIQEYVKVVERFSKGSYIDDAYFRLGACSMALGNLEYAATLFKEVLSNHRRSPFLKDARAQLAEVERRLSREKKAKAKRGKRSRAKGGSKAGAAKASTKGEKAKSAESGGGSGSKAKAGAK